MINCINISDPKVKALVDVFGKPAVEKGLSVFPANKDITIDNFIKDPQVKKTLGILDRSQIKAELGVSYGNTISGKGLAILGKTISQKNNKNSKNNIDETYYYRSFPIGESTENYYAVFKINKPLDLDAKLFREMQKVVDPGQNTNEVRKIKELLDQRSKEQELQLDPSLTEEQKKDNDFFNGDEALREQDFKEYELFQKQLDSLEESFFNINDADFSRASSIRSLDRLLYNTAKAMGLTVKKMKVYSKEYSNRTGKPLNQLGIANLIDKVLAFSEDDGVTFAEEMFHFIVAANLESPEIQAILNLKDENGIKLITKTDVWAENRDKYLSIYNNNMSKVELEVLGKLLAQYTYDAYKYKTIPQRLLRALDSFLRLFRIKTKFAKDLNRVTFNDELLKAFGFVLDKLENKAYNAEFNPKPLSNLNTYEIKVDESSPDLQFLIVEISPLGATRIVSDSNGNVYKFSSVENAKKFIDSSKEYVAIAEDSYFRNVLERVISDQELKIAELQGRIVGLISKENKDLFEYFKNKYPNINIQKEIETLQQRNNSLQPLTPTEEQTLEDLIKYKRMILDDKRDLENSKKIDRLQARVKEMKILLKQRKFHAGLYLYFFGVDSNSGVIKDIQNTLDFIEGVDAKRIELSDNKFSMLVESMKMHHYIINTIALEYANGSELSELTDEQNEELKKISRDLKDKINYITEFLERSAPRVKRSILVKNGAEDPRTEVDLNKETFEDSSLMNLWRGSLKNITDEWGRIFHNKLVVISKNIQEVVINRSVNLYNEIESDIKKIGASGLRMMKEKDENGNDTGYWTSERLTYKYEKAKEEYFKDVLKKLDEYAISKFNVNYNLQSGKVSILDFFNGNLLLNMKDESLDDELKRRKELQNLYNKYYIEFYESNTMLRPNYKEIMEERKRTMNATQYAKWYKANVRIITFANYPIEVHKGELIMPSDGKPTEVKVINSDTLRSKTPVTKQINTKDYTNKEYSKLERENPEVFRVLKKLKDHHNRAKYKLPTSTYSWEYENRLPQISKSTLDVVTSGRKIFSNLGEKLSEIVTPREDDIMYGNRLHGSLIKRPPIRFLNKIEPQYLTDDLLRAVVVFDEMTEKYLQHSKALPELQSMIDVLEFSKVKKNNFTTSGIGRKMNFLNSSEDYESGANSNLKKKLDFTLKRIIFGEEVDFNEKLSVNVNGKIYDVNKISERLFGWMKNTNLMGNTVSQLVGFFSGQLNKVTEIVTGTYIDKKDLAEAEAEALRNYMYVLQDFENPVKHTKIAIALQNLGLIDSVEESFGDLNKSRGTRVITKIADYGGWRAFDYTLKAPVVIAVAKNMRYIDENWISKKTYLGSKETKINNKTYEQRKEDWDNATSLWDEISTENGKLKYSNKVNQKVIDLWKTKTQELTLRIDEQTSEVDKALWHSHWFFRFFTLHQGWLDNMMGQAFKSRGYNWSTDQVEEGYYITPLKFIFQPWKFVDVIRDWHTYDDVEKANIKRIGMYLMFATLTYSLAYLVNAIALDEDDDENTPFMHALYVTTRLAMETSSKVSASEFLEYLTKPAGGLENVKDITVFLELLLSIVSDQEEVEKGFYTGYTKVEKNAIQAMPLVRGLFENLYGGYINEYLNKPSESVGIAINAKNNFVKTKNFESLNLIFDAPLGYYSKIIGYGIGRGAAEAQTRNAKSDGIGKLPTKKANE